MGFSRRSTFAGCLVLQWLLTPGLYAESPANPGTTSPEQPPAATGDAVESRETTAAAPAAYQLMYRFHPNQFVHYQTEHTMMIRTTFGDFSEVVRNETHTRKHYRVKAVEDDGTGHLELALDHVRMKAQFDDAEPVEFDSSRAEEAPRQFSDVLRRVGDPQVRMRIAATGELLSVSRLDGSPASPSEKAEAEEQTTNSFLVIFPEQPVAVGERWTEKFQVPVVLERGLTRDITLQRTYTLQSVQDGRATIRMRTSILTPVTDPLIRGQLIQRTPHGTIVFDLEEGVILSRSLKLDSTEYGLHQGQGAVHAVSRLQETRTTRGAGPQQTAARPAGPEPLRD